VSNASAGFCFAPLMISYTKQSMLPTPPFVLIWTGLSVF